MRSLGLAIDISSAKRPTLRAVLLEDSLSKDEIVKLSDINHVHDFNVPSSEEDIATQLKELSDALCSQIRSLGPDIVVVRRADRPPRANNQEGPRIRLMAEGAIVAAARGLVEMTVVRTGKECGIAYEGSKEEVDKAAELFATGKLIPAAAAAITGIMADRNR